MFQPNPTDPVADLLAVRGWYIEAHDPEGVEPHVALVTDDPVTALNPRSARALADQLVYFAEKVDRLADGFAQSPTFLEWLEDDGGWTVVELEPGGGVRLAGADEADPPDGSEPSRYFGRYLTPQDARELAAALVAAASQSEDELALASPAELISEALATLRAVPAGDDPAVGRTVLPNLVAAYERLTGSTL